MYLITNGLVVTMDKSRTVYKDGAILVDGNRIVDIGKTNELKEKYQNYDEIDADGSIILPGLINAHTHIFQTLYRGLGDDMPLHEWLEKCIWPLSKWVRREEAYSAMMLSGLEMIQSGTTTFVDSHYIHGDKYSIDGIADGVKDLRMRGVLGRTAVDQNPAPEFFCETVDEAQLEAERIIKNYHNTEVGRLTVRVEPLNETLSSPEMIKGMHDISKQFNVGLNMHIAETESRVQSVLDRFNKRSIEYLYDLGVLSSNTLLAHCVWINDHEMNLLKETGANVVHNVVANQYLADGVAPIKQLIDKGVNVTLGPDGAASNNNLDMFDVMKMGALIHKVTNLDPMAMKSTDVLEMVTIKAAKALGMEQEIGSLEVGKKADIIFIDKDCPEMVPAASALSNLVYSAKGNVVGTVMIDGEIVYQDRKFAYLDEMKIIGDANSTITSLLDKSHSWNLTDNSYWTFK